MNYFDLNLAKSLGGGGGGGNENLLVINYYADSVDGVSCDADYNTLNAALSSGKGVLAFLSMDSTYAEYFGIDSSYVIPSCYCCVEDGGIRIKFSIEILSSSLGTYTTFRGSILHSADSITVGVW